ncbi:MAG TPA: cytochrome P450 [Candidatus Bathyarchaeia archaeon]|nr:cytochrome P450 [Candidatus Bathyarchaeia archaeon]
MELNPFAHEFHEDPYPTYRWLRDNAPLYRNEALDFYALSRYRDVLDASHDWQTYSSAEGTTVERLDPAMFEQIPMMIFLDPPRHDRLRKLVNRVFTLRRVAGLEPFIRTTVTRLLDPLVAQGGGDFVKEVSAPLPMEVIFTMLGVRDEDRRELREWMDLALERDRDTPVVPERALRAMGNMMQYFFTLLDDLRRAPNDGLVSALLEAEVETDDGRTTRLSDGEIVGFCSLLGSAGNETVTKLLGNACVLLGRHRDQYARLCSDPGTIPGAVEEVLRYTSPSQYQGRVTTRDVEWYGKRVPRGSRILLLTASANRDEREFPDPDRFDVGRPVPIALGFGQGIHFCLGASLARLESRVALEEFSRRFPRYHVDEDQTVRVHMSNVHGYESVPFRAA